MLPSGKETSLWKITMFNGNARYFYDHFQLLCNKLPEGISCFFSAYFWHRRRSYWLKEPWLSSISKAAAEPVANPANLPGFPIICFRVFFDVSLCFSDCFHFCSIKNMINMCSLVNCTCRLFLSICLWLIDSD